MITVKEAEEIHELLINNFGGSHGTRDFSGLDSALARPFQTVGNNDLYPGVIDKAAALIESILNNHPLVDGNKRTGYVLMRILFIQNSCDVIATQQEKYDFVIGIASGETKYEQIVDWLNIHTAK